MRVFSAMRIDGHASKKRLTNRGSHDLTALFYVH